MASSPTKPALEEFDVVGRCCLDGDKITIVLNPPGAPQGMHELLTRHVDNIGQTLQRNVTIQFPRGAEIVEITIE